MHLIIILFFQESKCQLQLARLVGLFDIEVHIINVTKTRYSLSLSNPKNQFP